MIYPGWTPDYILDHLSPPLFFGMLERGRAIEKRRNFRHYYEMVRVTTAPYMDRDGRNETSSYYWEGSLTEKEDEARLRVIEQAQKDATKTWAPSSAALDFFRGHSVGRR